jgi:YgiT-type zinc finger domain-containing protein
MGKCVIERPRRGSKTAVSTKARHYGRIVEYDDGRDYDGLTHLPVSRKQEGYHKRLGDKEFTDLFGPLHGYLRSSCGPLWDDVYSEIKQTVRKAGWGVQHIISAITDRPIRDPFHYKGSTIFIDNAPVRVCNKCGEIYFPVEVYKRLENIAVLRKNAADLSSSRRT